MTTVINDYEVVRELGRGGQAITYLARGADGVEVALKKLELRGAQSWKAVELFEREATVLRNLDHPQIPKYVDSFVVEHDGQTAFYLAQELVDGETLHQSWDAADLQPVLTERQTLRLIKEIAAILRYLHGLSPPVIHRDIKPANIFRRPDGTFVLVDFGAVQALVPGTVGGSTFVGTSGYMAPEQLMGRAVPASDIFSLGATAIHMLSGFHPGDLPVRRMRMDFDGVVTAGADTVELLSEMVDPDLDTRLTSANRVMRRADALITEPNEGEMVVWQTSESWPKQLETDEGSVEFTFPISAANAAAMTGMWASALLMMLALVGLFVISDGLGALLLVGGIVTMSATAAYALARPVLRLDRERFELRRKRFLAPDIVLAGRLGSLEASADTVKYREGLSARELTALVIESGTQEEIVIAKKFDAFQVAEFILRFRDAHDR